MPPVNPCGMTVDLLRRGYTTSVKFFQDSEELTEVVWFPSVPGAPILPYATVFNSREWDAEMPFGLRTPGTLGLGEQIDAQRNYQRATAPAFHPWRGTFCGSQDQWENGTALPPAPPIVVLPDGFPACCGAALTPFPDVFNCHDQLRLLDAIAALYASLAVFRVYLADTWPTLTAASLNPSTEGPAPGWAICTSIDYTLVVVTGTTNAEQWAAQLGPAHFGPANQGAYSTHALHESAAARVFLALEVAEANHDLPLVLTGHSFGGSVANLVALKATTRWPWRRITILTIGCPKMGDSRLRNLLGIIRGINFVNDGDPVPRLPPGGTDEPLVNLIAPVGWAAGYARFQPPPRQIGLAVNGAQTPDPPLTLGIAGVTALAQQLIGVAVMGRSFAHSVAAYRARIALTCPQEVNVNVIGEVKDFAFNFVPPGWLACDGAPVSRVTYAALFAYLGTLWGPGDGLTTFNLPKCPGVSCVGSGVDGDGNVFNVGDYVGANTTTLITDNLPGYNLDVLDVGHVHGVTDPGHDHAATDSGHGHAVTDPGHAHAVTDPGHTHSVPVSLAGGSTNSATQVATNRPGLNVTASAVTGLTVNSQVTGLTIGTGHAVISVDPDSTGLTVNVASTGVIVNSKGMSVPFSRRPPQAVFMRCIWPGP